MKRTIRTLLVLFSIICVALLVCDFFGRELAVRSGVLAGSERLSLWERFQYTRQGNAGDISAMKHMARYYGIWRNDQEQEMRWVAKSATAGDPADQHNYGVYLFEHEHSEAEGLKWLRRSADAGDKYAKRYLQLIEENHLKHSAPDSGSHS